MTLSACVEAGRSWRRDRRLGACAAALAGAALALGLAATGAWAQSARDFSVKQRPRPEFQPLCVPTDLGLSGEDGASGFLVCPKLKMSTVYEDNVFRVDEDEEDDISVRAAPQVAVRSNWANHAVSLLARGEVSRYADLTNNDWEDFEARLRGRLDIREDLYAVARGSYGRFHEDRGDPDAAPGIAGVNQYFQARESLQLTYQPTDLEFRLEARGTQYDWQDNGPIDNDGRDRGEYETALRAGMEFREEFLIFVEPSYNIRRYRLARDAAGFDRDSQGFEVRAGVRYDVTGLTYLEASAGYFRQTFEDPRFETADGVAVGVDMTWNPTDLVTVDLSVGRSVEETTQLGVSSIVRSRAGAGLQYEIAYDLLFDGFASYRLDDFRGTSREDESLLGRAGLTYLMNEYLSWGLRYTYNERTSTLSGAGFTSNTAMVTVRGQL